jgi:hypothetical protein
MEVCLFIIDFLPHKAFSNASFLEQYHRQIAYVAL